MNNIWSNKLCDILFNYVFFIANKIYHLTNEKTCNDNMLQSNNLIALKFKANIAIN